MDNEVFEKLGDIVRERECVGRKLSTTYSLGRDRISHSQSKSLLPLHKGKTKRYSFKGAKKESVTIFHTPNDTSSSESSIEGEIGLVEGIDSLAKAKAKAPMVEDSSSSDLFHRKSPSEATTSSKLFISSYGAQEPSEVKPLGEEEEGESVHTIIPC